MISPLEHFSPGNTSFPLLTTGSSRMISPSSWWRDSQRSNLKSSSVLVLRSCILRCPTFQVGERPALCGTSSSLTLYTWPTFSRLVCVTQTGVRKPVREKAMVLWKVSVCGCVVIWLPFMWWLFRRASTPHSVSSFAPYHPLITFKNIFFIHCHWAVMLWLSLTFFLEHVVNFKFYQHFWNYETGRNIGHRYPLCTVYLIIYLLARNLHIIHSYVHHHHYYLISLYQSLLSLLLVYSLLLSPLLNLLSRIQTASFTLFYSVVLHQCLYNLSLNSFI